MRAQYQGRGHRRQSVCVRMVVVVVVVEVVVVSGQDRCLLAGNTGAGKRRE